MTARPARLRRLGALGAITLLTAVPASLTSAAPDADPTPDPVPADSQGQGGVSAAGVPLELFPPVRTNATIDPTDIHISRDGRYGYVLTGNELVKLDVNRRKPTIRGRATNIFGRSLALHPNGRTAYVIYVGTLYIVKTDVPRPVLLSQRTVGGLVRMAISPNGRYLYLADFEGRVSVMSLKHARRPRRVGYVDMPGGLDPQGIVVNADNTRLTTINNYSDIGDGSVSIIDIKTKTRPRMVRTLPLPWEPMEITAAPNGLVYVGNSNNIAKINIKSPRVVRTKGRIGLLWDLAVSPGGGLLYLVLGNPAEGVSVRVMNARTFGTAATVRGAGKLRVGTVATGGRRRGRLYMAAAEDPFEDRPPLLYSLQPKI